MYILVKENDVIMHISGTLGKQEETGYWLVDNGQLAISTEFVQEFYELEEIPENIEPEKYCYNPEQGFFKNKDFVQYYSPEEKIEMLENMVNMLLGF